MKNDTFMLFRTLCLEPKFFFIIVIQNLFFILDRVH